MDGRFALSFLILLIFIAPAQAACIGYNDTFDVRVLDGSLKPVEGAAITVKYDRGSTFGEQYFTTPMKYTDASGKVHYDIFNQGTLARKIDCNIEINATAGGASKKMTVVANEHGPVVDVILNDVYLMRFYVRDQLRAPLQNATVTIGALSNRTDKDGMVKYYLKKGVHQYFASYQTASQPGSLNVTNETAFEIIFTYYKVGIDISDDAGKPIDASITILNETALMEGGHYGNDRLFGEMVPYTIDYRGIVTEDVLYPASEPIVQLRYDLNAPLIKGITPDYSGGRFKLHIEATDPNQYASGLDVSSVKVQYKIEPSDASTPWSSAVVFTAGRSNFTADFPELPPNKLVSFRVELKDKTGNRAEQEGKFSTFATGPGPGNQTNNTQNQTNTQPPPQQEQGIPLIYIIGGVIVLILGVYLVFRIKSKA
ncbi:MAG: hypothetical protein AB1529_04035 [Candidatus Micrarchaeota archaeon]